MSRIINRQNSSPDFSNGSIRVLALLRDFSGAILLFSGVPVNSLGPQRSYRGLLYARAGNIINNIVAYFKEGNGQYTAEEIWI
jgi:hypothetical protein